MRQRELASARESLAFLLEKVPQGHEEWSKAGDGLRSRQLQRVLQFINEKQATVDRLSEELKRKDAEIACLRGRATSESTDAPPFNSRSVAAELIDELRKLDALDEEIKEIEGDRESVLRALERAQQIGDNPSLRKAIRGFSIRLEQLDKDIELSKDDPKTVAAFNQQRNEIRTRLIQLEDLGPARAQLAQDLVEIEERLDSLQAAKRYRIRRIRSRFQRPPDAPLLLGSHSERNDAEAWRRKYEEQRAAAEELRRVADRQAVLLSEVLPQCAAKADVQPAV
jgi:DNA repair exonuclease SbcCD ATPase subunit